MSSRKPRVRAPRCCLLVPAFFLVAGSVHATGPDECIASHERGQRLRRDGRLLAARTEFAACADDPCPGIIRQDCAAFERKVAALIPSVVLGLTDAQGKDVPAATVVVDDAGAPSALDARAVELDPGSHRFTFRSPSGQVRTMEVVLNERERMRIVATLPPAPAPAAAEPGLFPAPTLSYVFAGIGIAGLASFTGFAMSGKSKQDELEQCAPHCAKSDVDTMRTRYLVGDISLAVGVASLGAAAYFFFADPFGERAAHREKQARLRWTAFAAPGFASAAVFGRF
jgi:hypothetical protein